MGEGNGQANLVQETGNEFRDPEVPKVGRTPFVPSAIIDPPEVDPNPLDGLKE